VGPVGHIVEIHSSFFFSSVGGVPCVRSGRGVRCNLGTAADQMPPTGPPQSQASEFSASSRHRDLNRSATNIPSACRIANIALDDAMILRHDATPGRMEFSERTVVLYQLLIWWLCSQSRANPSLPAISGNAGRFCQIAGISPSCLRRKPPRFNALQAFSLVRGAGRTIVDSRDCLAQFMGHLLASIANKDCPLCPRKQTCSTSKSMSAKCHKRKSVVPSDSAKRSLECRSRPHGQ
jgi:hypothetical protein